MPRSESEIQAEIDAMKAKGVHPASKLLRPLRDELKALSAPPAPEAAQPPAAPREPTTSDAASAVVPPPYVAEAGPWVMSPDYLLPAPASKWASEEHFIDETLTKLASGLDFGSGSMSNVVKKLYERLDAALKVRRLIVDVVKGLAPGDPLPQFSKLGRDPNTGAQRFVVSEEPFAGDQLPKSPPSAVPTITEGGMPINNRPTNAEKMIHQFAGGMDVNDYAKSMAADIRQQLSARPPTPMTPNAAATA